MNKKSEVDFSEKKKFNRSMTHKRTILLKKTI